MMSILRGLRRVAIAATRLPELVLLVVLFLIVIWEDSGELV